MNYLEALRKILKAASCPGHFYRDSDGGEHELTAYVVRYTHEFRGAEIEEVAVVIGSNYGAAARSATAPYSNVKLLSVTEANPGNNRVLLRQEVKGG